MPLLFWICSGVLDAERDEISVTDMAECMTISFNIVAPGGTVVTFCAEDQVPLWKAAASNVGFFVEHLVTVVRSEYGRKRAFSPHTKVINNVQYVIICRKTVKTALSFVNFDVDECGTPHIIGRHQTYLVNGNVFADHKFVKGIVRTLFMIICVCSYLFVNQGRRIYPKEIMECFVRSRNRSVHCANSCNGIRTLVHWWSICFLARVPLP